jgi:hypothetical protein
MPTNDVTSIGNAMNHNNSKPPQLLVDYAKRKDFADEIGVCQETLIRWEKDGHGPPVTYVGRTPYYYRPSAKDWLRSREKSPAA